jgi:PTH1 family peptidyl-tRNA hydrolase
MSKFLIVGLGNIGSDYEGTRHNIGFEILNILAQEEKIQFQNDRLAEVAHLKLKGKPIVLIKPTTYMNLSGKAVNYWMQTEKIDQKNILVLVDEMALPLGKIRITPKGSDGGHNGLKNIQECLGNSEYPRLRFGIGKEFAKGHQVNYVLGKWTDEEKKVLDERIKIACDAIRSFAFIGIERTMNTFNAK